MFRKLTARLRRNRQEENQTEFAVELSSEFSQPDTAQDLPAHEHDQSPVIFKTDFHNGRLALIILLLVALALIASGIPAQFAAEIESQWPWVLIILGGLGFLIGIITAWAYGTLGGPIVAIWGLLNLLDDQLITTNLTTAAGFILVAVGVAIIVRGLTMPRT